MADIWCELEFESLVAAMKGDLEDAERDVQKAVQLLAAQAHAHIKEQVQSKLHSRREMYDKALKEIAEVSPGIWVITLAAEAAWIEEGMEAHSMVDDLLRQSKGSKSRPAKTAKDGSLYRVIPFQRNKGPTQQSPGAQLLTAGLKEELKKRSIPYAKIERNPDGSAKSGLLHKFSMTKGGGNIPTPDRPQGTQGKPGWGKGAVGQPMQGPNAQGGEGGGTPLLHGVAIYQTPAFTTDPKTGQQVPDVNKRGQQKATRSIMTFRVVSSKHRGVKWQYPGIEGTHFFEEAERWVKNEWETRILPDLIRKHSGATGMGGPD